MPKKGSDAVRLLKMAFDGTAAVAAAAVAAAAAVVVVVVAVVVVIEEEEEVVVVVVVGGRGGGGIEVTAFAEDAAEGGGDDTAAVPDKVMVPFGRGSAEDGADMIPFRVEGFDGPVDDTPALTGAMADFEEGSFALWDVCVLWRVDWDGLLNSADSCCSLGELLCLGVFLLVTHCSTGIFQCRKKTVCVGKVLLLQSSAANRRGENYGDGANC